MKYSSIIVEDLQPAADFLRKFCERSGIVDVQAHFLNGEEALVYLSENLVDLIFLDVEMPGITGFQLMDQLVYQPQVILTTSKTESVQKVEVKKLQEDSNSTDHIFIKVNGKLIRLKNEEILYIESMGDYVKFVTADKKYITHNTIKNLETKVDGQKFLKVHRSYIVNLASIDDIQENTLYIRGNHIPISKAHKSKVMQKINII
jgi:DNA-binding LytR/AlgR family response regulator